jgi:hypothetical protein
MHLRAQPFWLPKAGNPVEDYEDAFWPRQTIDREVARSSFAVADGATETSFAGIWAEMLARAWCRGQLSRRRIPSSLPDLQRAWLSRVRSGPLPWYAEEKLRSGAFSSLLGLTLGNGVEEGAGTWHALAVGDSCLVQVRAGRLLSAFPLTSAEEFHSRPVLLSSNPAGNRNMGEHVLCVNGTWEGGDRFYLMTDALACWFLRSVELDQDPCVILDELARGEEIDPFAALMAELRASGSMRNDDLTLLAVAVE